MPREFNADQICRTINLSQDVATKLVQDIHERRQQSL